MWVRLTAVLIVISILMGLNYLLLEAPAYPERSIHFFYGVSAGAVFLVAQVAGLVDLWKRRPAFIRWIVPPALYLLAIGLIGFFKFGNALPLATDSRPRRPAPGVLLRGVRPAAEGLAEESLMPKVIVDGV